jgi:hypothetical protein
MYATKLFFLPYTICLCRTIKLQDIAYIYTDS